MSTGGPGPAVRGIGLRGFLGTHTNRVDAKGRVSIPAAFRAALREPGQEGPCRLILRPSHTQACLEAWPEAEFGRLAAPLERMERFSESHEDLALSLYAAAHPVESDREGRIMLPEGLAAHAQLLEAVVFMGLGPTFQLWEPVAAQRRLQQARERAQALTLPGSPILPSAA